jgi:hypothetical protein
VAKTCYYINEIAFFYFGNGGIFDENTKELKNWEL